jgi:quinol monooxygenase YgiN
MIFFLVEYTCFNPQGADKVLDSLSRAAQYQIDNSITGVLTYHFSRPSMEEPEKLRFIEFYTSEKAFWEHSMEPMVSKELMVSFDPNIRKSFSWWAFYSNDIEKRAKETVATLKGIEVSPFQKHVNLNYRSRFILEPVLLVGKLSKKQNNLRVFLEQNEGSFSESAIYQFFFNDPMGDFHIISLWPSQEDIISSLIQLDLPEAELRSQIYLGKENPTNRLKGIFEPWNPRFLTEPEAGYCLHPKYIE